MLILKLLFLLGIIELCSCNTPPYQTGLMRYRLTEDTTLPNVQLHIYDPEDSLNISVDPTQPQPCGSIVFLPNLRCTYTAGKDCEGVDTVPLMVSENRVNGSTEFFDAEFYVVPVNDDPHVYWVSPSVGSTQQAEPQLMEQLNQWTFYYPPPYWPVAESSVTLLAWDVDLSDIPQLVVHGTPDNGTLTTKCYNPPPSTQLNCSLANATGNLTQAPPIPDLPNISLWDICRIPWPRMRWNISWVICDFSYDAQPYFYGAEYLNVSMIDKDNAMTVEMTAEFVVLENLCIHQSNCTGNLTDFNCTQRQRSNGFDSNYYCSCVPGYRGRFCEEDINECLTAVCRWNETCVDKVNAYECVCPKEWPCNYLKPLLIGVGCAIVLMIALIVVPGCLIYRARRRRSKDREQKPLFLNRSSTATSHVDEVKPSDTYYLTGPKALPHINRPVVDRRPARLPPIAPVQVRPPNRRAMY